MKKPKRESTALIPDKALPEEQRTRLVDEDESYPILISPSRRDKTLVERGIEELQRLGYTDIEGEVLSNEDATDEISL